MRVLVLAGGLSHERDVSVRSGRRVAEALRAVGMDVDVRDVDAGLLPALDADRPDVVFPLLHGATGEDGSVRDLLELAGVPYVGSTAAGARLAWSKPVAKALLRREGAATPDYTAMPQSMFRDLGAQAVLARVEDAFGFPLVVKPASGGSALGVSLVHTAADLPHAMVTAFSYVDEVLVERAVTGTELAVSVVDLGDGPRALPPVEIVTEGAYDYDARYNPGRSEYFAPARLPEAALAAAGELALTAHRVLGLRHLSRVDMIVDADGVPWFLEANVAPGMTETSLFPQAVLADGGTLEDLYSALVAAAAG